MNEVEAVGVDADKTEQFRRSFEQRNDSDEADDFEEAACARGEIDENVIVETVMKLQRRGIEDQPKNQSCATK